ncbi:unnamed protein product [Phytophthora lilii]|uniref:Unnamed protein product n=1 Tax=Phytophthora lilii TaxID=2077276 RepID=A0A9W6XPB5_9STRA|nr:unnamed protein product [Phytophthora lilii]
MLRIYLSIFRAVYDDKDGKPLDPRASLISLDAQATLIVEVPPQQSRISPVSLVDAQENKHSFIQLTTWVSEKDYRSSSFGFSDFSIKSRRRFHQSSVPYQRRVSTTAIHPSATTIGKERTL